MKLCSCNTVIFLIKFCMCFISTLTTSHKSWLSLVKILKSALCYCPVREIQLCKIGKNHVRHQGDVLFQPQNCAKSYQSKHRCPLGLTYWWSGFTGQPHFKGAVSIVLPSVHWPAWFTANLTRWDKAASVMECYISVDCRNKKINVSLPHSDGWM